MMQNSPYKPGMFCPDEVGELNQVVSLVTSVGYSIRIVSMNATEISADWIPALTLNQAALQLCNIPCVLSLAVNLQGNVSGASCHDEAETSSTPHLCVDYTNKLFVQHTNICSSETVSQSTLNSLKEIMESSNFAEMLRDEHPMINKMELLDHADDQFVRESNTSYSSRREITPEGVAVVVFTALTLMMMIFVLLVWWKKSLCIKIVANAKCWREKRNNENHLEPKTKLYIGHIADGTDGSISSQSILEELEQLSKSELDRRTLRVESYPISQSIRSLK